jgi:tellurite resistance protein
LRVTLPGGCYDSHVSLDTAFDFQLGWQNAHEKKPGGHFNTMRELTWHPQAPKGMLRYFTHVCFGTGAYLQAEELMRATLAAAALVLIADGRVTADARRHAIDAMMRLPIGKYFAEFEVRNSFDKILHDLKLHRKTAEAEALKLLASWKGKTDAAIIVYGMQQIAMLDGQVSIHEERMVERLTRYLQASANLSSSAA